MFNNLFEPIDICGMRVKNRVVMPAMGTGFAASDGSVSKKLIDYFVARAKGGVGLIIVEATAVSPGGIIFPNETVIYNDKYIKGYKELTEAVHLYGAKIAIQLAHGGRQTKSSLIGLQPVAPSKVPARALCTEIPKELSLEKIRVLIEKFAEAAGRSKKAGFDAIEVHGAHGYLISQFLSPDANLREDRYGGDLIRRARFAQEIIQQVKQEVGADFPVSFRFNGDDYVEGGLTLEESKRVAPLLIKAGANVLSVSAGVYGAQPATIPPMGTELGCFVHLAERIKAEVDVPIITAGRIKDPQLADTIIKDGKADMVAMGRALLADPEMPNKALNGRIGEIRKCIGCGQGCIETLLGTIKGEAKPISCMVNPRMGREGETKNIPAKKKKKVLIIGGGPGGLQAALTAALRGHKVTICEKEEKLGGNLLVAALPPGREEFGEAVRYFSEQIDKLPVTVELGKLVTREEVEEMGPDVAIVATGSLPETLSISGIDQQHVVAGRDVLLNRCRVGDQVLIIGGDQFGLEVADFLLAKGKRVTVVNDSGHFAKDMGPIGRFYLRTRLAQPGVQLLKSVIIKSICDNEIIVLREGREESLIGMDTIILTTLKPNNQIVKEISSKVPELYVIGDAVKPRKALEAILEGFEVARKI